jgi:hypothetical protein
MYIIPYIDEEICLLDMTRIPEEWYPFIMKKMSENNKTVTTLNEMVCFL